MTEQSFWPEDSAGLRGETLDRFLVWCARQDASRIEIQTEMPVMIRVHGRNRQVTRDPSLPHEVEDAITYVFRSSTGVTHLRQGIPLDLRHTIRSGPMGTRHSFRLNALGTQVGSEAGISITFRPLADIPRPLDEQHVEPALLEALHGERGMYLICGATGSGKTTLIGGVNRARLEDPDLHCDIIEGSEPLELLYDLVPRRHATISQVEIPRDVSTFAGFIRAAMRREPTDIVVGECRDSDTMEAAIQAAISGHRLTSSLHTFDCASTVRRVAALCPPDQRDSLTIALVENLRLLVNQRLLPSTDGKRTAIREFLPVNRAIRDTLLSARREDWPHLTHAAIEAHGQSFERSIRATLAAGRITETVAAAALREEA